MKVLFKDANKNYLELMDIENSNTAIHNLIDGYYRCVHIGNNVLLLCDEDGIAKELNINYFDKVYGRILGNVIFCGMGREDFDSLSDEQIQYVSKYLQCTIRIK